ncbi:MAG TPA: hypothetical protein ENI04_01235 [Candidatus Wildermuthbacteria bacterium]|nr:hypothetical protein [Candidatus Wildermuthbacteria bacterium]
MTNLQKIREACIKANNEIVELKFGCETEGQYEHFGSTDIKEKGIILSGDIKDNLIPVKFYSHREAMNVNVKDFEIIGRPIRLADIFLADRASLNKKLHTEEILEYWNLTDDNLENQSKETIDFIAGLL